MKLRLEDAVVPIRSSWGLQVKKFRIHSQRVVLSSRSQSFMTSLEDTMVLNSELSSTASSHVFFGAGGRGRCGGHNLLLIGPCAFLQLPRPAILKLSTRCPQTIPPFPITWLPCPSTHLFPLLSQALQLPGPLRPLSPTCFFFPSSALQILNRLIPAHSLPHCLKFPCVSCLCSPAIITWTVPVFAWLPEPVSACLTFLFDLLLVYWTSYQICFATLGLLSRCRPLRDSFCCKPLHPYLCNKPLNFSRSASHFCICSLSLLPCFHLMWPVFSLPLQKRSPPDMLSVEECCLY